MNVMKVLSIETIARKFLDKAASEGKDVDPLKLLKLVYLAQGWMLGLYGRPLTAEDVEAWRYGPVYRRLYKKVAGKDVVPSNIFESADEPLDMYQEHLVDQVWDVYGDCSGEQLSTLTHQKGTPWDVAYQRFGLKSVIPKDLIQEHYADLVAQG